MDTTSRRKVFSALTVGAGVAAVAAGTASTAEAQSGGNNAGGPVGTNLRAFITNTQGAIVGTFDIKRFAAINGAVQAIGTVTAAGTTTADGTTRTAMSTLSAPVSLTTSSTQQAIAAADPASCPILHLAIGAIDLNLLGLVVTTNPIVLDIVAVPGPGNLLGNLLCTIAGLLNPGGGIAGALNQIVGLLNQILAQL